MNPASLTPDQLYYSVLGAVLNRSHAIEIFVPVHTHGMGTARRVGLAKYINQLCAVWAKRFVPKQATEENSPYMLESRDVFVVKGDGTPEAPFLCVVPALDLRVRAILGGNRFRRFQVPKAENIATGNYQLAGPVPIGEDHDKHSMAYFRRLVLERFCTGSLGKGAPYRLDTDCEALEEEYPGIPRALIGAVAHPSDPPRLIWDFVSPSPRTSPIETHVETAVLGPIGELRPNSTPAQRVDWTLEIDLPGEALTVWRIVFLRSYPNAVREANEVVRQMLAAHRMTAPQPRGQERVQTLR